MTKERPILFSGPMVRAILEGRKTQTRRVVNLRDKTGTYSEFGDDGWPESMDDGGDWHKDPCPYGAPGDRLWVKETACYWTYADGTVGGQTPVVYADSPCWDGVCRDARAGRPVSLEEHIGWWKKRSSIHMPRRYSRLTLEVVAVRVERLQEISEADAKAEGPERNIIEGLEAEWDEEMGYRSYCRHYPHGCECFPNMDARDWYQDYWNHLNGAGSWDANPFVWVVEFKRLTNGEA